MAKILITGGAGFMGRWVARNLIGKGHDVWIMDNFSNCSEENIKEFRGMLQAVVKADIKVRASLSKLFENNFDMCIHLAATINVQESIDNPDKCFDNNVVGTFYVLDECRKYNTKIIFVSSALIYEKANDGQAIVEDHPLNPSCPYAASKIAGEELVTAYFKTYNLPMVILRPFSIYGPWQRCDSEGGVMSIFIDRNIKGQQLEVFGDGEQSRDFFYVDDCAEFIVRAAFSDKAIGEIFNAGSGQEIKIKNLASKIAKRSIPIRFIEHHHLFAEIMRMRADSSKAREVLGWKNKINLDDGIENTKKWLISHTTS